MTEWGENYGAHEILTWVALGSWESLTQAVNREQESDLPAVSVPSTDAGRVWLIRYAWSLLQD